MGHTHDDAIACQNLSGLETSSSSTYAIFIKTSNTTFWPLIKVTAENCLVYNLIYDSYEIIVTIAQQKGLDSKMNGKMFCAYKKFNCITMIQPNTQGLGPLVHVELNFMAKMSLTFLFIISLNTL